MGIQKFKNRIFSGKRFETCLYDDSEDYEKPNCKVGYPWAMVYFAIDTETIVAYGVERSNQSPFGLLKKVKTNYFSIDFNIKPKIVETEYGKKITYYAKKIENIKAIIKETSVTNSN
jgi:hypothetical protein